PARRPSDCQDCDVQLILAAEVVVDHALGGAHESGDLVDPRPGVPVPGELPLRDLEDLRFGALGVASALAGDGLRGHAFILSERLARCTASRIGALTAPHPREPPLRCTISKKTPPPGTV